MKNRINKLREYLHRMIESKEISYEEIVKTSKELDQLIVNYHNEKSESKG